MPSGISDRQSSTGSGYRSPIPPKANRMACTGCQKRREALARIVRAPAGGKTEAAAREIASVVVSAVTDAKAVLRTQVQAARNRLAARSPKR